MDLCAVREQTQLIHGYGIRAGAVSGGVWRLTAKKDERTFQNDRNGLSLDRGLDCMGFYIHQNQWIIHLRCIHFTTYKFYLKKNY